MTNNQFEGAFNKTTNELFLFFTDESGDEWLINPKGKKIEFNEDLFSDIDDYQETQFNTLQVESYKNNTNEEKHLVQDSDLLKSFHILSKDSKFKNRVSKLLAWSKKSNHLEPEDHQLLYVYLKSNRAKREQRVHIMKLIQISRKMGFVF